MGVGVQRCPGDRVDFTTGRTEGQEEGEGQKAWEPLGMALAMLLQMTVFMP